MKHFRNDCRKCGKDSALNQDELVRHHGPRNRPCEGSGKPPAGEPPCGFWCGRMAGRVAWPEPYEPGQAHASTYVCFDPEHQREAALWVKSVTGHEGVFVDMAVTPRA